MAWELIALLSRGNLKANADTNSTTQMQQGKDVLLEVRKRYGGVSQVK